MNEKENEYMIKEIKNRIKDTKTKISEIDILISKLSSFEDISSQEDVHIPTEGLPYIYGVFGEDKTPGIKIPASAGGQVETFTLNPATGLLEGDPAQGSIFTGFIRMESDSTFVCEDILGAEEVNFVMTETPAGLISSPPDDGRYLKSLSKTFQSTRKVTFPVDAGGIHDITIGHDLAFRLTDVGTGRNLFAVEDNLNQQNVFIPGRALKSGLPWSSFGPNLKHTLSADHVFAKNALIKVEVIVWEPADFFLLGLFGGPVGRLNSYDTTVFISLLGSKVYGE